MSVSTREKNPLLAIIVVKHSILKTAREDTRESTEIRGHLLTGIVIKHLKHNGKRRFMSALMQERNLFRAVFVTKHLIVML